ncbi:sensor histidine kinase [Streptomyces sp. URMC 127]|uniref:sensor histidine kinase n=1 Tax=Streptomyces sp. URMC 127 TaxID=3423402 RepID=UPI003F1B4D01
MSRTPPSDPRTAAGPAGAPDRPVRRAPHGPFARALPGKRLRALRERPARAAHGSSAHGSSAPDAVAVPPPGSDMPSLRLVRLALHGSFYVLLAVAAAPAAAGTKPQAVLLPAAVLAAVYGLGVVRPTARRGLWLTAVTALWLLLLAMDHGYSYVAFPLFFLFLGALPVRWAHPAIAAATAAVVAAQAAAPGGLTAAKVIGPAAGAAVAILTGYGYAALYRESRKRQQLIDDLLRTRDELAAAQREAGRLAERQRLAREIHDTLAQGLSSIVLLARAAEAAEAAGPAASGDAATVRERIREIGLTASDNLAEARRFVQALTPPALEDAPLPEALRRVTARTVPGAVFRLDGDPRTLPMETEVALLRLTQEALANVARHAHAEHTAVTLAFLDGQVTLDVYDDGVGFAPGDGPADGRRTFGLHGMRERIAALGGTLTVESAPGEGTAIAAVVPVGDGARPRETSEATHRGTSPGDGPGTFSPPQRRRATTTESGSAGPGHEAKETAA